jgi:hypothetical protein
MIASGYLSYSADRRRYSQVKSELNTGTLSRAFNGGAIPSWPAPCPRDRVSDDFQDVRAVEAIPLR